MKALVIERSVPRFAAARLVASVSGSGRGAAIGPLRLMDTNPPELPGDGWNHVKVLLAGICGSDLATLDGKSSRYFEDLVSFPFVPGHEIVGTVSGEDQSSTRRVVVEPAIGCVARNISPLCVACAEGRTGGCERVAFGLIAPGLQIGYCCDTGGGWSAAGVVAHESQIHEVPDSLSDEDAVMVEPSACALHAALAARADPRSVVCVLGAGTLGLAVVAALRRLSPPSVLISGARYPHQRDLAAGLGADEVVVPDEVPRAVRRRTRSLEVATGLTGGADAVVDCVGSADSLRQALAVVKPGGRVILAGMPGSVSLDMAGLWHREVSVKGAYAYGVEHLPDGTTRRTFDIAFDLVSSAGLGRLVSATYPLDRYEEAIAHAGSAGRRGAVKIAFDLRESRSGRWRRALDDPSAESRSAAKKGNPQ